MENRHNTAKPRRILCIDGGGIKGTLPAAILAELEADLPKPIGAYFDLIAGTSTGGILAIGLALGKTAAELLALYEERGPTIFGQEDLDPDTETWLDKKLRSFRDTRRHLTQPKHDASVLSGELADILQDATIGDAKTRLVIPAWDPDLRRPYIYKTAHHQRLTTDYRKPALDAAMATAAAPTYFKRHRTSDDVGLTDGGTWANNPVAIAVVEAITILGWNPQDIQVLSLGCSDDVYMLPEEPGLAQLNFGLLSLYGDGQSHGALGMAKLLLDHPYSGERLHRISPPVPSGFFSLDDTTKIKRLKGMGISEARNAKPHLRQPFFENPTEPFTPIYSLPEVAA